MRRSIIFSIGALALTVAAVTAHQQRSQGGGLGDAEGQPASAVVTLLHAQPYVMEESYTGWWRAEQPQVDAGWLLVLRVPPGLAELRQSLTRVLYVGEETAERWNSGQPTGNIVVTVPWERGADGLPAPISSGECIWFGTPELPERVDAARIASERQLAASAQLPVLTAEDLQDAQQVGGGLLEVRDSHELGYAIADLIETYSPEETVTIETLRITPTE